MPVSLPYPIVNGTTGDGTQMQANLVALLNGINAAAQLNSPSFTGIPTAPTAAPNSNTAQLATTAFATTADAALATALTSSILATVGGAYAPLNSPAFTGAPTAPTAAVGTNTTQLATAAFVQGEKAPAVQSVTSAATVTPVFGNDMVTITAQAAALTLANPTGTAIPGWGIVIRIKDSGAPQTIAYGTQYRGIGVVLPTTTVAGKTLYLGVLWNSTDTTWDAASVAQQ
jgi:hypothetical protein